uniref:Uncharacterized protein n=1 Tax=Chromera velia CCMP2878 TaxID=1169474 RepID=A0A0G4H041_9ALVE|mmetsp:Transcript_47015/g.92825  ORF Transcript_47015/g.92825 Transcript_47015/m.92825 type:complete len:80 (+) Transcript_47015:893-1132(+)|eukprot:Cvel_24155.t1-p1 / transcript=Cvel_24155.t1 / gene=Cvel_24155 / organism=Chromera_velia_CCMP2878 / gene_product=hypothetical protein / transcript_product=hypothetical protein / location=Cvel_scaffold2578:16311-16547(+) / protein_length=79 / sequence_SO=supercontig / SO=protein_coding / is_pseudo=false
MGKNIVCQDLPDLDKLQVLHRKLYDAFINARMDPTDLFFYTYNDSTNTLDTRTAFELTQDIRFLIAVHIWHGADWPDRA